MIDAPDINDIGDIYKIDNDNFAVYVDSTPTYNNMIMEVEDKIQNGLFPEIMQRKIDASNTYASILQSRVALGEISYSVYKKTLNSSMDGGKLISITDSFGGFEKMKDIDKALLSQVKLHPSERLTGDFENLKNAAYRNVHYNRYDNYSQGVTDLLIQDPETLENLKNKRALNISNNNKHILFDRYLDLSVDLGRMKGDEYGKMQELSTSDAVKEVEKLGGYKQLSLKVIEMHDQKNNKSLKNDGLSSNDNFSYPDIGKLLEGSPQNNSSNSVKNKYKIS